ncbi:hypothetical protein QTO17_23075, partial [Vibrio owensii]
HYLIPIEAHHRVGFFCMVHRIQNLKFRVYPIIPERIFASLLVSAIGIRGSDEQGRIGIWWIGER